ncbi:DUF4292 domain-containing protein [Flavobacterium sp.]|uniref:DUF4292 domain-containing protein n=1 Tax=Flavobacterium sp. TaxID=239 RepID=UPI0039E26BAA
MNKFLGLLLVAFLCSCKAAKPVVAESNTSTDKKIANAQIIDGHYANKRDFVTAYIKSSVRYQDDKNTQNVSAEIRIKKNEMILVSVRLLGITMAKALITPTQVKYYEKINGNYFEGDYAALSQWLGTDLDFQKVQNLLIGQALDDLKTGSYTASTEDNLYQLKSEGNTSKTFYFEPDQFLLRKQEIAQAQQQRMMQVLYPNYAHRPEAVLPTALIIDAVQKKGKTNINIEYNSVTFNEAMTFPYSVPDGYERIHINN